MKKNLQQVGFENNESICLYCKVQRFRNPDNLPLDSNPKKGSFASPPPPWGGGGKASSMKQADLQDTFRKAIVISPDLVSYSITYLSYEDSRKHRRGP